MAITNDMAHTLCSFETSPILFGTADGVLIYEDGLKVLTWPEAMERIAPEVEEAKRKRELERRQQEIRRIMAHEATGEAQAQGDEVAAG